MGSYATTTSISNRFPGFLIGDTTTSDSTGSTTFSQYIDKAETMFNAVAAKRYSMPFTTVPPLARELSLDIGAYYTFRALFTRDFPNRMEWIDDFKISFEDLKKLENGEIKLTLTDGSLVAERASGVLLSNRTGQDPVFEVDEPTAWKADEDRLDALEDARD